MGHARAAVLAVQHDGGASLGALRAPLLERGVAVAVWQASREPEPPAEAFDALLVLGGGANPDGSGDRAPLERERTLLREAHERGAPVLGICLGAQLAAQALGGRCLPSPRPEHGWRAIWPTPAAAADPLLAGLRTGDRVMQWHAWSFEPPPGAVVLAENDVGVQAFRAGTTWGLQFHPEVTRPALERQAAVTAEFLAAQGYPRERLLADTTRWLPRQLALAAAITRGFAGLVARAAA